MKRFAAFLILFCALYLTAEAATQITATIAVTNAAGTTNGQTLTVNGDTRTWTNAVYVPASQIKTASNATLAASALLNHAAVYKFSGLTLSQTSPTNLALRAATDAPLTVTLSAGWGTVSYATNTVGSGLIVSLPIELHSPAQRTNIASLLVAAIANYATNLSLLNITNAGGAGGGGETNPPAAGPTGYQTNLMAYFKADEAAEATEAVDSVNGYNLPIYGGPVVSTNGIIGNAWDVATFKWRRSTGTNYNFVGRDFTIRFWLKPSNGSYTSTVIANNGYELDWQADRTLLWRITKASGEVNVTSTALPSDLAWHRVICWCSNTNQIGIQIDNGSPVTASITEPMYDGGSDWLEIGFVSTGSLEGIDELAFWDNYVLTADDMTLDWNGGAGRTYPLPSPFLEPKHHRNDHDTTK